MTEEEQKNRYMRLNGDALNLKSAWQRATHSVSLKLGVMSVVFNAMARTPENAIAYGLFDSALLLSMYAMSAIMQDRALQIAFGPGHKNMVVDTKPNQVGYTRELDRPALADLMAMRSIGIAAGVTFATAGSIYMFQNPTFLGIATIMASVFYSNAISDFIRFRNIHNGKWQLVRKEKMENTPNVP